MKGSVIALTVITAICVFLSNGYALDIKGVSIHGFLSQGYVQTTDNNLFAETKDGTFQFNELGINFSKDLTDRLRAGVQLFSKDYGKTGNHDIEIDWAYGDYHFRDWLGVRAGKIKVPHGLYNQTRDVDMLRTYIFLPQSIYPEILRDSTLSILGGGLYGNIDLRKFGGLSYQAAVGKQRIKPSERTMQAFMDTTSNNDIIHNDSIEVESKYAGSMEWYTPMDGLRISWTIGNTKLSAWSHAIQDSPPTMTVGTKVYQDFNKFQYIVYSAEYAWRNLTLSGEYMKTERSFSIVIVDAGSNKDNETIESDGWYAGSSYRFTDWFVLGTYYSYSESNNNGGNAGGVVAGSGPGSTSSDLGGRPSDLGDARPVGGGAFFDVGGATSAFPGRNYQKDLCITTRFNINEYIVFKLEGHSLKGTNGLSPLDNPEDANNNRWTNEWKMFAAKMTLRF